MIGELLDDAFREAYITEKTRGILGVDPQSVEFIDAGVLNYVFKVTTEKGILFFKQALDRAKKADKIGGDLAAIPKTRIKYEKNVIDAVGETPSEIVLPYVYEYDEENNVLIMGDVALGGVLLEDALLQNNFNKAAAENIGRFLAITHRNTIGRNMPIRENEEEDKRNWEIFLNMRTRGINASPAAKEELSRLFDEVSKTHTKNVCITMDCCPKNIFQREDGSIGIVDFELASGYGDTAYDLGFALGHYLLFATLTGISESAAECFAGMVEAYKKEFGEVEEGFTKRAIKYAGAVLIYRVAGSSPASYIPKERVEELKEKGAAVVISDTENFIEIIEILKG